MSTRATYCFEGKNYYYIHYDNYPSGAAKYFQDMLNAEGNTLEEKFEKATGAEKTESHEKHGDTDWRYDLFIKYDEEILYIRVYECIGYDLVDTPIWDIYWYSPLQLFIDTQLAIRNQNSKTENKTSKKNTYIKETKELLTTAANLVLNEDDSKHVDIAFNIIQMHITLLKVLEKLND